MRDFLIKKQRIVVRGLLQESERVLLVRDMVGTSLEYYDLPGGYVSFGKDPSDALIDLFFEQTRIPVNVGVPLQTISRMSPHDDVQTFEIVYQVFPRGTLEIKNSGRESILWVALDDSSYFFSSHIAEIIRRDVRR